MQLLVRTDLWYVLNANLVSVRMEGMIVEVSLVARTVFSPDAGNELPLVLLQSGCYVTAHADL
jgi:hypothetical protein